MSNTRSDHNSGNNCCTLNWSSNRDGVLGATPGINAVFTSTGERVITLIAEDSDGARSSVSFTINVVNSAPTVDITAPLIGQRIFRDEPVIFRGTSVDINEPDGQLACDRLRWVISGPEVHFFSGCEGEVVLTMSGPYFLALHGTDPQGITATERLDMFVQDPPPNLPPVVRITSPENDANISSIHELLTFSGTATDPEGETDLSYTWSLSYESGGISESGIFIGSTPSFTGRLSDFIPFGDIEGQWDIFIRLSVIDPGGQSGTDFVTLSFVIIN